MSTAAIDPVSTPAAPAPAAAAPVPTSAPVATTAGVAAQTSTTAAAAPAVPTRLLGEDTKAVASDATAPVDGKPAEVVAEAAKADAAAWELKAPEGSDLPAEAVKAAETFAKENGLTQAQAEKILARDIAGRTASLESQKADIAKTGDVWLEEAKKHPEIGGDKLPAAVANAKRAMQAMCTAEERQAIANSPFANNPMFIAIMNRAAGFLPAEDTIHTGAGAVTETNAARIMYGNR